MMASVEVAIPVDKEEVIKRWIKLEDTRTPVDQRA